jgi:CRP-like cAMP-binding protein
MFSTDFNRYEVFQLLKEYRKAVDSNIETRLYKAGKAIISQGEIPHKVQIISKGLAKAYHLTSNGKHYLFDLFSRGEILGEVEILHKIPYFANVEAVEDCEIIEIPQASFIDWLKSKPDFSLFIIKEISWRLQNTSEKAVTNQCYPLAYSVMKTIYNRWLSDNSSNTIVLPKALFAEYLGTSIRSLNRILHHLSEKHLIEVEKSKITLLSEDNFLCEMHNFE